VREAAWKYLVVALGVALAIELSALAAGRLLARRGFVYAPAELSLYEEFLRLRDPLLGWPAPSAIGTGEVDRSGSRLVPRYADPARHPSCVALFGDSFTWGDEVAPADSYANALSGLLGCRVANYGVPGYGTDQAYLRFRDRIRDGAKVAVLAHWSEDIIRNVNQFRGFISAKGIALKPRFTVDGDGRLVLVPIPELGLREFAEIDRRRELLPHEYFHPGGPSGVTALRFPYSASLLHLARHHRLRARLRGDPAWAEFYDPAHPSGALQVTLAILRDFVRVARERGQEPVVLVLPDVRDLQELRESGRLAYAPLLEGLARSGIEAPDAARRLLELLAGRDPCVLFTRCPGGHLNPEGHALVARIARDWIAERGLAVR
jgi:hypothetical protein